MYEAVRDSRIAILPIGYADGIPRNLSCGKGEVLIRGCRVPIAGRRVSMDQLAVDITDIPDAAGESSDTDRKRRTRKNFAGR